MTAPSKLIGMTLEAARRVVENNGGACWIYKVVLGKKKAYRLVEEPLKYGDFRVGLVVEQGKVVAIR